MSRLFKFIGRYFLETSLLVGGMSLVLLGLIPSVNVLTVILGSMVFSCGLILGTMSLSIYRKKQRYVHNMVNDFALFNVEEVAEFTDLTPDEVVGKAMTGEIKGIQIFGEWYFQGDRVMDYREKQEARR